MKENRIVSLFERKQKDVLNIYFTAGFPALESTSSVIASLEKSGVDLIELGMPYSDPLADGTTIQNSSQVALKNGMNLPLLFDQIKSIRHTAEVPLVLMGYYNQVLQYGVEKFVHKAVEVGVDGMILPDLPMDIYEKKYKQLFEECNMTISFLITPHTSEERIRQADRLSTAFLYIISQSSITGTSSDISQDQLLYFDRIAQLKLKSPALIGFGIHDNETFMSACKHANGAIIGSAFIRHLENAANMNQDISDFVKQIRG